MNDYLIYSFSFLFLFSASLIYSYRFQKNFTSLSSPPKILVGFVTGIILFSLTLFGLLITDIFKTNEKIQQKDYFIDSFNKKINLSHDKSETVILILSGLNVFTWIILPFLFFFYYEEESLNTKQSENIAEDMKVFKNDEEEIEKGSLLDENNTSNINSPTFYQPTSAFNINFAKNYFYYFISLAGLNIIYLITFKIYNNDSHNNLLRLTQVPEGLRVLSYLGSDYQILTYANFGLSLLIAKILFVIYVPYGAGKLTASLVEKMRSVETVKHEYSNLNNTLSKNYETIKNLTSQKLMTGRILTKKEKKILKSCKDTETILNHKQEILEDKYSNFQMCLFYILLPLKFILILMSFSFVMLFVTSKGLIIYDGFVKSKCGSMCGYLVNARDLGMTVQNLLYLLNDYIQICLLVFMFMYFLTVALKGMSNLGLISFKGQFVPTEEVRGSKISNFLLYSVFLLIVFSSIFEIFSLVPNFSFFHNMQTCDVFALEKNSEICEYSNFGLFYIKFYLNFYVLKYADIFLSVISVCLFFVMILYYPLKSAIEDWNKINN
jgi:hypothetical protein